MPTAAEYSSITYILREHIENGAYEDFITEDDKFIAWLPKNTNGGGLYNRVAFSDASVGGVGWSFGAAQASKRDMSGDDWHVDWYELFSLLSIGHKAMMYARNSADRLEELVSSRLDSAAKRFSAYLGYALWGNGGGAIDVIAARDGGGASITLTNRHAIWLAERNMALEVSVDDGVTGSAGITALGGVQVVATVNRPTLVLTPEDTFNASWAAGNFVYSRGSYQNVVQGVEAWCPLTAPGATLFNGVDRSVDDRRSAVIFDPTGLGLANLGEALNMQATFHGEENPGSNEMDLAIWMNPRMVAYLQNVLGIKLRYDASEVAMNSRGNEARGRRGQPITIGKMFLPTDRGELAIMSHRNIPYGRSLMLDKGSMELTTMGEMYFPLDFEDDDRMWTRHSSENAAEARMGGYPNLFVRAPHRNCVADLSSFLT